MIGLMLLFAFTPAEALRDAVARQEAVPAADVEIGCVGLTPSGTGRLTGAA
jgi:hypothetical protein